MQQQGHDNAAVSVHNRVANANPNRRRKYGKNLDPETCVLIIRTGWQLEIEKAIRLKDTGLSTRVFATEIIDRIGTHHNEPHNNKLSRQTVSKWWKKKRKEFEKTGKLVHKPRSGRPQHEAFRTAEKIDEVIDYALQLGRGKHLKDVLDHFNCSRNTYRKYCSGIISWVLPPKQEAKDNQAVWDLRCDNLARGGGLTERILGLIGWYLRKSLLLLSQISAAMLQ